MGCAVEPRVELALRRTIFYAIILFAYLIFGTLVLSVVPSRHQPVKCERNAEKLDAQRSEMLNVLWAETMAQSEHEWALMANNKLEMYERALLSSCSSSSITYSSSASSTNQHATNTFSNAFIRSFTLITTIGFIDVDTLTTGGKIFAIVYAIIGIPLALLYLGQCSKIVSGLLPGDRVIGAAIVTVFITAIIYDIVEDTEDDTPFIDAILYGFLFMTTIGKCGTAPSSNGILVTISLVAISLLSMSFVVIERHIENSLQGFEMAFGRQFALVDRWLNSRSNENDHIIEEEEGEEEGEGQEGEGEDGERELGGGGGREDDDEEEEEEETEDSEYS